MIIDSISSDHIQMIKGLKTVDEYGRTFYKVRAYCLQEVDLKTFRDREPAQDYLDKLAEEIAAEDVNHIVIASEL